MSPSLARVRPFAVAAFAAGLSFGLAGCGGDDEGSSTGSDSSTTAAPADAGSPETTEAMDSGSADAPSTGENPGPATLANGTADEAHTVTFTADSVFSPDSIEVAPGELLTFKAAEGAPIAGVTFNGNDSYTITGGLIETFTLETPGEYTVEEDISGATMTVTVTG